MQSGNYSYQLRTLRAAERAQNRDLTAQALEVLNLRLWTIQDSSESEETKQRQRDAAMRQWEVFMQREIPAVG